VSCGWYFDWQLLAADIRHERNVILQCVRFLTRLYSLHERDHQYRDQSGTPERDDSEIHESNSVNVHSAGSKSSEDRQSSGISKTPHVTVEAEADVGDIPRPLSDAACGISGNSVSETDRMLNCDGCDAVSSVASVVCSSADTSIAGCCSENGDISDSSGSLTPCNNNIDVVKTDAGDSVTRFMNDVATVTSDDQ